MNRRNPLNHGYLIKAASLAAAGLVLLTVFGCGSDNGAKPEGFGTVSGTVHLPFSRAASTSPASGAQVHVFGGDFDTTSTTDTVGAYTIQSVPARTVTVTATLGECLSAMRSNVGVRKNETTTVDLSLESHAEFDTIPLPSAGARRMEISPNSTWGVLLYDAVSVLPNGVTIVRINLSTGAADKVEFPGLTDAFDILFTGNDEIVFSFLSAAGYGLRFVKLATLTADGDDIIYENNRDGFGGRLAIDGSREHVFVTHTGFQTTPRGPVFPGKVLAYSVAQRTAVDADSNPDDGNAVFDTTLVRESLAWPNNIAFDDARQEILVGNRNAGYVTAIDWRLWGTFDRSAGLVAPVTGVRKVAMNLQAPLLQAWLLDFADGVGIAAYPQHSNMVRYESGADGSSLLYTETAASLKSEDYFHFLTIVPSRQSWFTLFEDGTQTAVEERSLGTLRRVNRYESNLFVLPDRGQPRAFAVDAANKRLYVGYRNRAILEVFCLP